MSPTLPVLQLELRKEMESALKEAVRDAEREKARHNTGSRQVWLWQYKPAGWEPLLHVDREHVLLSRFCAAHIPLLLLDWQIIILRPHHHPCGGKGGE